MVAKNITMEYTMAFVSVIIVRIVKVLVGLTHTKMPSTYVSIQLATLTKLPPSIYKLFWIFTNGQTS